MFPAVLLFYFYKEGGRSEKCFQIRNPSFSDRKENSSRIQMFMDPRPLPETAPLKLTTSAPFFFLEEL